MDSLSQRRGDFGDGRVVRLEQLAGSMGAQADEEIHWLAASFWIEQAGKSGRSKTGDSGQVGHCYPAIEAAQHVKTCNRCIAQFSGWNV